MKTRVLLALTALVTAGCVVSNADDTDQVTVTFQLRSDAIPAETRVYITGSLASLGNWRPDAIEMKHIKEHVWQHQVRVPVGSSIEYKYTLGSWGREGAGSDRRPLPNLKLTAKEPLTKEDQIDFWTNRATRPSGQITGTVEYHRQLGAPEILPRDVIVWLPPSYTTNSDERYPVLYMHDGQNLFDPQTSAFGIDWQVDETCTEMIEKKTLRPMIVVGIYNTRARSREYGEGANGSSYRKFVVDELKPLIDKTYRTKPDRQHTYCGGSSAGGLCAFIMAWEQSDIFSRALCMSPAFRFHRSDGTLVIDYVSRARDKGVPANPIRLYIDNGGLGVDQQLQSGVDAMLSVLRDVGMKEARDFNVVLAPSDPHNESAWAKRLPRAFELLLD